jgi:hypothetical protein
VTTQRAPAIDEVVTRRLEARVGNRHLRSRIEEVLPRLVYPGEQLHDFAEGIEWPTLDGRAMLGSAWPWLRRVVLVFTDRRLIELSVRPLGRSLEGRIRTFAWSKVMTLSCDRHYLTLSSRDRGAVRWELRTALSGSALKELKGAAAPLGELFGSRLCDRCGSAAFSRRRICSRCTARVTDPREVAAQGWTIPGAGLVISRHPLLGFGRLFFEIAALAGVVWALLAADGPSQTAAAIVVALWLLPLIRLEGVRMAGRVAARSGVGERWSGASWGRLRIPALVLTVTLLAVPLFFVGSIERHISADLEMIVPEQIWHPVLPPADDAGPEVRSAWSHRDGWTVTVTARSLEPFASFEDIRMDLGQKLGVGVEPADVANFEGLLAVNQTNDPDPANRLVVLELHVFDRPGRDLHTLTTAAPAQAVSHRATEMRDLLRHAIWVPPRQP